MTNISCNETDCVYNLHSGKCLANNISLSMVVSNGNLYFECKQFSESKIKNREELDDIFDFLNEMDDEELNAH